MAEGLTDAVYRNAAAAWPLWVQVIVALVVLDFVQWCVHIVSCWDWMFGIPRMPAGPPRHVGFAGVETFPTNFFSQELWPLQRLVPLLKSPVVWTALGAAALTAVWYLSQGG